MFEFHLGFLCNFDFICYIPSNVLTRNQNVSFRKIWDLHFCMIPEISVVFFFSQVLSLLTYSIFPIAQLQIFGSRRSFPCSLSPFSAFCAFRDLYPSSELPLVFKQKCSIFCKGLECLRYIFWAFFFHPRLKRLELLHVINKISWINPALLGKVAESPNHL